MEKKLSLIPLFSVFILTMALIKVYVFYNNFNVPIKYFINISELTVIIFEDLIYIVPPLLLLYVFMDKRNSKIEISEDFKSSFIKKAQTNPKDKFKKLLKFFKILIFIFYAIFIIGIPIYIIISERTYVEKIFGITLLGSIILIIILITKNNQIIEMIGAGGMILSVFFLMFAFFFMLRIFVEIDDVEKGKFFGTKIITEKNTYISTPDSYYIGQTSSYIFIFNRLQKQSTIIPSSEVKSIELYIKK